MTFSQNRSIVVSDDVSDNEKGCEMAKVSQKMAAQRPRELAGGRLLRPRYDERRSYDVGEGLEVSAVSVRPKEISFTSAV